MLLRRFPQEKELRDVLSDRQCGTAASCICTPVRGASYQPEREMFIRLERTL